MRRHRWRIRLHSRASLIRIPDDEGCTEIEITDEDKFGGGCQWALCPPGKAIALLSLLHRTHVVLLSTAHCSSG